MNVLLQLRRQLASESERQTEGELTKHSESDTNFTLGFPQQGSSVEPLHLVSTLRAYRDLGFHPSQGLLTAAEPFLSCLQQPLPLHSALDLTSLFRAFTWQPGGCSTSTPCSVLHHILLYVVMAGAVIVA